MSDPIDRQSAINTAQVMYVRCDTGDIEDYRDLMCESILALPSAQPEIIKCKDCRWWDKYDDYDNGYCMAAKHGYLSEHWEISIRRTYKGDFYCADAEPKGEQE